MYGQDGKDRQEKSKNVYAVLPYMKGVTERLERAYKKHDIQLFAKLCTLSGQVAVCLKDPLEPEEKCGVAYKCKCEECSQLYVGKTERSLGERYQKNMTSLRFKISPQSTSG